MGYIWLEWLGHPSRNRSDYFEEHGLQEEDKTVDKLRSCPSKGWNGKCCRTCLQVHVKEKKLEQKGNTRRRTLGWKDEDLREIKPWKQGETPERLEIHSPIMLKFTSGCKKLKKKTSDFCLPRTVPYLYPEAHCNTSAKNTYYFPQTSNGNWDCLLQMFTIEFRNQE